MEATAIPARSRLSRVGYWLAELILVFLGVYSAFWLNNYQQHQQDAKRRDQLLAALEEEVEEIIENSKVEGPKQRAIVAEFKRALDAGEMPPLRTIAFETDYSPSDNATLLSAGGLDLLDIKTVSAIRSADRALRGGLTRLQHFQKLSDEQIIPNLDQDISFFYDPATRRLRKRFATYPVGLQSLADFFPRLEKAYGELLTQIRAERQRH